MATVQVVSQMVQRGEAERLFQTMAVDFVIPLLQSRRVNLLLFQCAFVGYGIAKAMSDTSTMTVTFAS
ncbi:hypothetical protein PPTG_23734 [Phytophthora nicotianae INRA-310]|uniref:Uncharacterized protein n=1 Tax=Phytophthora nicotianae (strain INRA-310) TaxID=761204 RepID=W2PUI5_PHYN3|nr:hypothetical protein PPTG_23734 [Phytophthora nicotianae INRA-310]ETN03700.1 hypothetical protein PPTG_23734 [Phytophthora nicotianae INRA-310]